MNDPLTPVQARLVRVADRYHTKDMALPTDLAARLLAEGLSIEPPTKQFNEDLYDNG